MEPRRRGWWSRNWKWFVPVGCLGLVLLGVLAAAGLFFGIMGGIKRSEVFQMALERARSSPAAVEALGEPIEPGWWVSGSVNVSGAAGEASLAAPVSGPQGEGKLYVEGVKQAGEWRLTLLELEVEGGERIDLLAETVAGPAEPGEPYLGELAFSEEMSDEAPVDPGARLPAGARSVYATFDFGGLAGDDPVEAVWYRGGLVLDTQSFRLAEAFPDGVPDEGNLYLSRTMEGEEGLGPGYYRFEVEVPGKASRAGAFTIPPEGGGPWLGNPSFAAGVAWRGALSAYPKGTGYRFAAGSSNVRLLFDAFGMGEGASWGWRVRRDGAVVAEEADLRWSGSPDTVYAVALPVSEPGLYDVDLLLDGAVQASDSLVLGEPGAPGGEPAVADSFDDPGSGWTILAEADGSGGYEGGAFRMRLESADDLAWSALEGTYGDFVAEVEVTPDADGPVEMGLAVRHQGDGGFHGYLVSSEGDAAPFSIVDGQLALDAPWGDLPPELLAGGDGSRTLRVLASGPELRYYVDGRLVARLPEARWADGQVALVIGSRSQPGVGAAFDDFRLWALPGGEER